MWPLRAQGALASSYHCPVFLTQCTRQGSQHAHLQGHWPSGPGGPCQPACLSCPASHPGSPRKGALLSPRAQNTVPSLQPKLASPLTHHCRDPRKPHAVCGTSGLPPPGTGPGKDGRAPEEWAPSPAQPRKHTCAPGDQTPPSPTHTHRPDRPQQHPRLPTARAQPQPLRGPRLPAPEKPFHAPVTSHSEGQNSLLAADG